MGEYKGPVRILPRPAAYPGRTVWGKTAGPVAFLGYVEQPLGNSPGIAVFVDEREMKQLVLASRKIWGFATPEQVDKLQAHIDELEQDIKTVTRERDEALKNKLTVVPVEELAGVVAAAQRPVVHDPAPTLPPAARATHRTEGGVKMARIPYGFEQITVSSTAIGPTASMINKPNRAGAETALFRATTDVRWRDDGVAPTATIGYLLKAGEELVYDGNLETVRFIRVGSDATLDCCYYT